MVPARGARAYFQQLAEMGETELVLEDEGRTGRTERRGRTEAAERTERTERTERRGRTERTGRTAKGGPAMYPAGITVPAPKEEDLFSTDPVRRAARLEELRELIEACRKCSLGYTRTHIVPGEGNPNADLVCCGEAPGQTEDETGRPFVGASGQLLTEILRAIGIDRHGVIVEPAALTLRFGDEALSLALDRHSGQLVAADGE